VANHLFSLSDIAPVTLKRAQATLV